SQPVRRPKGGRFATADGLRTRPTFGVSLSLHFHELRHHLVLARLGDAERGGVAVHLRVLAEMIEARVPLPRAPRRLGIDAVEVELVRAVRGFADEDEMRVADQCEETVVVAMRPGQFVESELGHRSSLCCRICRSALGKAISAASSSHARTMAGGTPTECAS